MAFLDAHHIERIYSAFENYKNQDNFAVLVDNEDILQKNGNMAINLYIRPDPLTNQKEVSLIDAYKDWEDASSNLKLSMQKLFEEML